MFVCLAACTPAAFGAFISPCSSGVVNESIIPVKTSSLTYCVSDFGWSDTFFKGVVASYSPHLDVFSGEDSFNIKWDGSTGHGYLSPSMDVGTTIPDAVSTIFGSPSQWSVSTEVHYTSAAENETQSVIVHPSGLEVAITTTGMGSMLSIRFDLRNTGTTPLMNLILSDYYNFHPHGSFLGDTNRFLGTTAFMASCPPSIGVCDGALVTTGQPGQPNFISHGYLFGQSAPSFWGLGYAAGVTAGEELWQKLAQGIYNGLTGSVGPGDTAGILGWNLGNLGAGEEVSFTVYKGLYDEVPEPGTWLLVLSGAALVLIGRRRRAQ